MTCRICNTHATFVRGLCRPCYYKARSRGWLERFAAPRRPAKPVRRRSQTIIRDSRAWPADIIRVAHLTRLLGRSQKFIKRHYPLVVVRREDGRRSGVGVRRKYVKEIAR